MSAPYILFMVLEGFLGLIMVILILLHSPKGEGMGGIGGAATLFTGKRGAESGLDKLTWTVFSLFLTVSMILGFGFVKP